MLIQKNPQLKEDAGWLKNIMLQHAYVDEKKVKLQSFHWRDCREVTANVCVYKTDKGEYMHPIDMNAEMARRFANLEKYCNINEPLAKVTDKRALRLQELYAYWKDKPVKEAKYHVRYLNNNNRDSVEANDERYVIVELLKLDPYTK